MSEELVRVVSTVRVKSIRNLDMEKIQEEMSKHLWGTVIEVAEGEVIKEQPATGSVHVHSSGDYSCDHCMELAADRQS